MTKKERIAQLENEVAELKLKVMMLEASRQFVVYPSIGDLPCTPNVPLVTWEVRDPIYDQTYCT